MVTIPSNNKHGLSINMRENASSPLAITAKVFTCVVGVLAVMLLLRDSVTLRLQYNQNSISSVGPPPPTATATNSSHSDNRKTDALLAMMGAVQELQSMQLHWDVQIRQIQDIAANWQDIGFTPQEIMNLFAMLGEKLQEVACRGTKGGDCYDGASTNHKATEYLRLNLDHFRKVKAAGVENPIYCETGFNYGKSSMAALLAGYTVYSFDIQQHPYSEQCAHLTNILWPDNKFTMTEGSSFETLPQFHSQHPEIQCNVLSIDGMHDYNGVTSDFRNLKKMSKDGSLVFIDDIGVTYGDGGLYKAWNELIREGSLVEKKQVQYGQVLTGRGWRDLGWGVGELRL